MSITPSLPLTGTFHTPRKSCSVLKNAIFLPNSLLPRSLSLSLSLVLSLLSYPPFSLGPLLLWASGTITLPSTTPYQILPIPPTLKSDAGSWYLPHMKTISSQVMSGSSATYKVSSAMCLLLPWALKWIWRGRVILTGTDHHIPSLSCTLGRPCCSYIITGHTGCSYVP